MATADVIVLCVVAVFALLGAIRGASRQLALLAGTAAGCLLARPIGQAGALPLANALGWSLSSAILAATAAAFVVVLLTVRAATHSVLLYVLTGEDEKDRGLDRLLGLFLGAAKAAAIVYVLLCAALFVEKQAVAAGRRAQLPAKGSLAVAFARSHNFFELPAFAAMSDVAHLLRLASDPAKADKLQADPGWRSLLADPRFREAASNDEVVKAAKAGNHGSMLKHPALLRLVADPETLERLTTAPQLPPD